MIDYRIFPEHCLMVVCHWGSTCTADIQNMRQVYRTDPDFSPDYDAFVDFSCLDQVYTLDELHKLSNRFVVLDQEVKVAFVTKDESLHQMVHNYKSLTESKRSGGMRVFRTGAEALKWLGREDLDMAAICADMMANCRFGSV